MDDPDRKPSRIWPVVAATLPAAFSLTACLLFGATIASAGSARAIEYHLEEMGPAALFAIVIATVVSVIACSVLLYVAGRGVRVPLALVVGPAALPWLAGLLGARYAMGIAREAVASADPASRATMMARGIAEASNARLLGAMLGSGLLAAVGLGFALDALGQRAPKRSIAGAGIGALAGLPLVALALYALLAARSAGLILVIASIGALLAMALAGAGIGADEPRARSAALGSAVPIASGLAVYAAAVASSSMSLIVVFGALANAERSLRGALVARAAEELGPLTLALSASAPVALAGAAALAGWSVLRARPSPGRIAGAAALVVTSLLVVAADLATTSYASSALEGSASRPWGAVEGFAAVSLHTDEADGELDGLLRPEGLSAVDGEAVSSFDPASLDRGIAELRRRAAARLSDEDQTEEEIPEWLRAAPSDLPGATDDERVFRAAPGLALAVDRRVNAASLRALFDAAARAHVEAIQITGDDAGAPSAQELEEIRAALPMLAAFFDSSRSAVAIVGGAVPSSLPDRDPSLFHVTLGASAPLVAEVRAAASVPQAERSLDPPEHVPYFARPEPRRPLYVALADDATAASLAETIDRATRAGFVPVVVTGAIPGGPGTPMVPYGPPAGGLGLGNLGGPAPSGPEVRGSLSRDAIRRVVRQHTGEVRACYERELARHPDLQGRVRVNFISGPTGHVQSAAVSSSTLGSEPVESCITGAVRSWRFPAPDGGGIVGVNYPFVLQSS